MCGRFTQKNTTKEFEENIYGYETQTDLQPRHNIKPTQYVPIVSSTDGKDIKTVEARWWMQKQNAKEFDTKFATFNARTDKLESSFLYKPALEHRRCLVPVSTYYEWSEKGKPPFEFSIGDKPFALAGLWNNWFEESESKYSFTIITTDANEFMSDYHDRMPIILSDLDQQKQWLKKGGMDLLVPYQREIKAERLTDRIEALYPN